MHVVCHNVNQASNTNHESYAAIENGNVGSCRQRIKMDHNSIQEYNLGSNRHSWDKKKSVTGLT